MVIYVCMGSSCHLKGSYEVVKKLEEIKGRGTNIEIFGHLCFGQCSRGVCVEIDGKIFFGVNPQNIEEIINKVLESKYE